MNNQKGSNLIQPILKRIDTGLVVAVIAVLISFLAVIVAKQEIEVAQATQKAITLPVIEIDMGYQYQIAPYLFEITLTNSGPGVAYVQNVSAWIGDKRITDYKKFRGALMNGSLSYNAKFTERTAAGFIKSGASLTPWRFEWSKSDRPEIDSYLRGVDGPPMKDVDLEVCYCSIFNDCWMVRYSDRHKPKPVQSCGSDDVQDDFFQTTIELRAASRAKQH